MKVSKERPSPLLGRDGAERVLDVLTHLLLLLTLLLGICGGVDFLFCLFLLLVVFAVRTAFVRFRVMDPFRLDPRGKWAILRLLEIGVVLHVVPIAWANARSALPLSFATNLGGEVRMVLILLTIRLILGRNFRALTALVSTAMTLLVVLYGLEWALRATEARDLNEGVVAVPVEETGVEETGVDRTLNDGVRWTWGQPIDNNSHGFREDEFAVPKPPETYRVMILGDSLTWGAGLAASARYSDLLEVMLTEALPGRKVEVLNFGLPAAATIHERHRLVEMHEKVDPDLIVVGFCINDPQPRSQNYSRERARLDNAYKRIAEMRHIGLVKTYSFLIRRINQIVVRLGMIPTWEEALDRTYQPGSAEWEGFGKALEEIKNVSERHGAPAPVLILLTQGVARDQPNPPYERRWLRQAGDAARERGYVVVDPMDRFVSELTMADLPVNARDRHPSAACNRIYAEELLKAVLPLVRSKVDP